MDRIKQLIEQQEIHDPVSLAEARSSLLERLRQKKNDSEAMVLLTGVLYWLGAYAEEGDFKERYLEQGVEMGNMAAASGQDSVATNFWFASCMFALATLRGLLNSRGFFEAIEKHGGRALEIDETYCHCGPLRLMGHFYSKAPPGPVGPGDKKKGLELAERAVALQPLELANRVVLADAYLSARYFDESRQILQTVLASPEPAGSRFSFALNQAEARRIQERLNRME